MTPLGRQTRHQPPGGRDILVSLAAALLTGVAVFVLWAALGYPARGGEPTDAPFPGLWRAFFAGWVPALFPAFTLAHACLARAAPPAGAAAAAAALRWDRWTHLALPALVLWLAAWRGLPGWRLALGACFVTVLFAKALGLVVALYRVAFGAPEPADDERALPGAATFLGVGAALLYAGLLPYVAIGLSTAGDEPLYLLGAHSLWVDGDLDLQDNTARGEWTSFYWARGHPWARIHGALGVPALFLPAYAAATALAPGFPLAGRLAAMLLVALCAAGAGVTAYRLCRDLGCTRPAAFWAWVAMALTPPFVVASAHVYPEVPAALLALLGSRAALRVPARPVRGAAAVLGVAVALVLLKERYAPIALVLVAWMLLRLARRHRWMAVALLVGVALAGAAALQVGSPTVFRQLGPATRMPTLTAWNGYMALAALGMLVDQEYGLVFYAPAWALAVVGVPVLWRRHRGATLALVGAFALQLLVVAKFRWTLWDAGWSPPPRFVLSAAPLLIPAVAAAFDQLRGRALALVHTTWLAWSAVIAWCLAVVPFWRYNGLTGRSTLLRLAGERLELDLARFVPSIRTPSAWTWIVLAAAGVALGAAAVHAGRRRAAPGPGWGRGAVLAPPRLAAGVLASLALGWVAAAAVLPTRALEAEAMRHTAGLQFGPHAFRDVLWVMNQEGDVSERIVTWPGTTRITVVAGGLSTTQVAPRMALYLDDRVVGDWPLRAGAGQWVRDRYVATVPTGFGRPTLRIRVTGTLDHRGSGNLQHAYVDRVTVERVAGR